MLRNKASVSVIIPCYRCTDTIDRAVESVYCQTWQPKEVILVEDCSDDGTLDHLHALAKKYADDWVQVIESPKNGGPGTARNVGWEHATQPFVAFLDADDSWHPQKIEIQYGWMVAHSDVILTGHDCPQLSKDESPSPDDVFDRYNVPAHQVSKGDLLLSNRFPTRSVMLRQDIEQRFAKGKYHCEDYLLWLEIVCSGGSAFNIDLPLAYIHKAAYGEAGLSSQMWNMQKGELDAYRNLYKKNLINVANCLFLVPFSFLKYFKRVFLKSIRWFIF